MNISKRDAKLLIVLFGIIIFILCYFAVYDGKTRENDSLILEITGLQTEAFKLRAVESAIEEYNILIGEAKEQILESQTRFPSSVLAEDLIMYVVELQNNVGIDANSISFIQPESITNIQVLAPREDGGEAITLQNRTAYQVGVNVNFNLSYRQLKDLVKYIYEESEKSSLESINVSFNSATGFLSGVMTVNKIFIHAGDDTEAFDFPDITTGLPNPFGTIR